MTEYEIIVIGAGHAGCEAGLAAARSGKRTLVLSMQLEAIAMLACNPSIGGTGKGHLVREIDALGGQMGLVIDKTFIQSRMLNMSKGPAVQSLRAQADKLAYQAEMKRALEIQENLELKQGEVKSIIIEDAAVKGVTLTNGAAYKGKAVIIATGTFLGGKIFIGENSYQSGPNGLAPSLELADQFRKLGFKMRRFKTGTPARILGKSLDYSKMTEQKGDEKCIPFSFMNESVTCDQKSCWLTYTNEKTHEIIRKNFHRAAMFSGMIEGVGPRYCPSIEDKINRFKDKEKHQIFIEPEGLTTDETYIQGMSSSLPIDVQERFYRTIKGLENAEIVRHAYAIEYDCIDPLELTETLAFRNIKGLFCAGQFNGSSGYEEAAAQGLMAGINASLSLSGKDPFVLDRSEAYIGVLIDDLVTKGTEEPYRMMTSRAEYRLSLRQDNADLRLTEKAYERGLISEDRYSRFLKRKEQTENEIKRLTETYIKTEEPKGKISMAEMLRRGKATYESLAPEDPLRPGLSEHVIKTVEYDIKYKGYIEKQKKEIERFKKMEEKLLPETLDYNDVYGLRIEAAQKLNQIRPASLGQASRISGVSPADISVLLIYMEKRRKK